MGWTSAASGFGTVSVSANGLYAAAGASGDPKSRVQIISNPGGVPVETHVLQTDFSLSFMRLSPDGDRLLTFVDQSVKNHCFDTATGAVLPELEWAGLTQINDAAWLGGGRVAGLVTARHPRSDPRSEEWLVLWDAATGRRFFHIPNSSVMNCLAAAPGGPRFAEAGVDKMIRIRDGTTLAVAHEFRAHDASITALAWHPDRPLLASASADLTVKIWNPDSGECLEELRGFVQQPTTLQFSPTGRRLLTAGGGSARIWEPKSLR
jgi:WD40 repeat protein